MVGQNLEQDIQNQNSWIEFRVELEQLDKTVSKEKIN